ncbi:MAG: PD-(D/E)XK nuclease family protein [Candidatus Riflebacteria bacterium]|nr:PD-(D/E)XK nuclease family protein [Candidatus Riflebacteria bacterium]
MISSYSTTKLYITGSRLETYITCPRKYYYSNIRKLQKPFEKKSSLLAFDQALHKTLTSFYRFHNTNEPFDFSKLMKCLDYNWHNSDFESPEVAAEFKASATTSLKSYFENYCNSDDCH